MKFQILEYHLDKREREFYPKRKIIDGIDEYYSIKGNNNFYYFFRNQREEHLLIYDVFKDITTFGKNAYRIADKNETEIFKSNFKESIRTIKLKEIYNIKENDERLVFIINHNLAKQKIFLKRTI
jgi:hypothetical protein